MLTALIRAAEIAESFSACRQKQIDLALGKHGVNVHGRYWNRGGSEVLGALAIEVRWEAVEAGLEPAIREINHRLDEAWKKAAGK